MNLEDPARLLIVEAWDRTASHRAAARLVLPAKLEEIRPLIDGVLRGRYYQQV